jgi:hypothetical protein
MPKSACLCATDMGNDLAGFGTAMTSVSGITVAVIAVH